MKETPYLNHLLRGKGNKFAPMRQRITEISNYLSKGQNEGLDTILGVVDSDLRKYERLVNDKSLNRMHQTYQAYQRVTSILTEKLSEKSEQKVDDVVAGAKPISELESAENKDIVAILNGGTSDTRTYSERVLTLDYYLSETAEGKSLTISEMASALSRMKTDFAKKMRIYSDKAITQYRETCANLFDLRNRIYKGMETPEENQLFTSMISKSMGYEGGGWPLPTMNPQMLNDILVGNGFVSSGERLRALLSYVTSKGKDGFPSYSLESFRTGISNLLDACQSEETFTPLAKKLYVSILTDINEALPKDYQRQEVRKLQKQEETPKGFMGFVRSGLGLVLKKDR